MRRPDEKDPEAPGGKAGERLREFLDKRRPQDGPPAPTPPDDTVSEPRPPPPAKDESEKPDRDDTRP